MECGLGKGPCDNRRSIPPHEELEQENVLCVWSQLTQIWPISIAQARLPSFFDGQIGRALISQDERHSGGQFFFMHLPFVIRLNEQRLENTHMQCNTSQSHPFPDSIPELISRRLMVACQRRAWCQLPWRRGEEEGI